MGSPDNRERAEALLGPGTCWAVLSPESKWVVVMVVGPKVGWEAGIGP